MFELQVSCMNCGEHISEYNYNSESDRLTFPCNVCNNDFELEQTIYLIKKAD